MHQVAQLISQAQLNICMHGEATWDSRIISLRASLSKREALLLAASAELLDIPKRQPDDRERKEDVPHADLSLLIRGSKTPPAHWPPRCVTETKRNSARWGDALEDTWSTPPLICPDPSFLSIVDKLDLCLQLINSTFPPLTLWFRLLGPHW